jgi:hypothetical protein
MLQPNPVQQALVVVIPQNPVAEMVGEFFVQLLSSEMMRKRWAATKKAEAATQGALPTKTGRRKRRLTPEGRQRIADSTKRRWAAKRAADAAAEAKSKTTAGT